jgi:predicted acylesterase/phospholipase RssA
VTRVANRASERSNDHPAEHASHPGKPADPHAEKPAEGAVAETSAEITAILKKWSGLVDGLVESFRSRRAEPGLFEVMTGAVNIMQDRITRSRLAIDPADVLLRPDLTDFQLMDFHRAREAIDVGRAHVEQAAARLEPVVAQLRARE